ncbi:hypothetical protein PSP6_80301 [Paraburkholderia tropica]|nr:hypothetical protein PSP6_80301 [Paraburkholderia tropica]
MWESTSNSFCWFGLREVTPGAGAGACAQELCRSLIDAALHGTWLKPNSRFRRAGAWTAFVSRAKGDAGRYGAVQRVLGVQGEGADACALRSGVGRGGAKVRRSEREARMAWGICRRCAAPTLQGARGTPNPR